MRTFSQWAALGAAALGLVLPSIARGAEVQANPPGLAIGTKAPDFSLTGQDGKTYTLTNLIREAPLALVFYRSADW